MSRSVTIVGGGLAGFSAAQELRGRGFDGQIRIIDPEGVPYDRPPLSKEYLAGHITAEKLHLAEDHWFVDHNVELISDTVIEIDIESDAVTLAGGATVEGDFVIIATGGVARRLPVPGGDHPELRYLRTKADADAVRSILVSGHRLAIVGAGLIGAEVASTALAHGVDVTLVDPIPLPGLGLLGEEIATYLYDEHARRGVAVRKAMTLGIERRGTEWSLELDDGPLAADTVLIAVGIVPDTRLAEEAGLAVNQGILVDASQQTNHPKVFAAGDIARTRLEDGTPLRRHEHWESALYEGQRAAAGVLGQDPPVHGASWMWTDRYGMHVEAVGNMTEGTPINRVVDGRAIMSFRLDAHHHLLGVAALDGGNDIKAARRIIDRRIVCDPEKLSDPGVPLKKLAR